MTIEEKRQLFLALSQDSQITNGIPVPVPVKKRKRKVAHTAEEIKKVREFYDKHSVDIPDKKFFSKRLNRQRRVLTKPISLLHLEFLELHHIKISCSFFYKLRPNHIMKMKSLKFSQCLCETCENVKIYFKSLRLRGCSIGNVTDAVNSTLCPFDGKWPTLSCVERTCDKCGVDSLEHQLRAECDLTAPVTYRHWKGVEVLNAKTKKTRLVSQTSSVSDLILEFCKQIKLYSLHSFTASWQRTQFNELKDNLPDDVAVFVLDFAENYKCNYQNQVQSAYYDLPQVVLHPIVIYTKCEKTGHVLTHYRIYISDDRVRDAAFVKFVLRDSLNFINKNKNIVFSDNCGAQYKSRLPFHTIRELSSEFVIERCFFGERHGKSECDSAGGVVKSFLTRSAACGHHLSNAQEIVTFLNNSFTLLHDCPKSLNSRTFHLVESRHLNRRLTSSSIPLLPGTTKLHSLKNIDDHFVAVRPFSCFCTSCLSLPPSNPCLSNVVGFSCQRWVNPRPKPINKFN